MADDARYTGQRKSRINNAKHDRSRTRGARKHYLEATGDLSDHEARADDRPERQIPDLGQTLPRVGVMPQKRNDAEQHRRRAKHDAPEKCFHRKRRFNWIYARPFRGARRGGMRSHFWNQMDSSKGDCTQTLQHRSEREVCDDISWVLGPAPPRRRRKTFAAGSVSDYGFPRAVGRSDTAHAP